MNFELHIRASLKEPFEIVGDIETERSHHGDYEIIGADAPELGYIIILIAAVDIRLGERVMSAARFKENARLDSEKLPHIQIYHHSGIKTGAPTVDVPGGKFL